MTSLRFLLAALLASLLLPSCSSFEHFDSRYPTVSQQDAYDVSWGLSPRKVRGNPKMRYHAKSDASLPVSAAPSAPSAAPTLAPAPGPAPAPISPTVPSNLR